jgi:hypothetical protein
MPEDFPSDLKNCILNGWSKETKSRPPLEEFKKALHKMLPEDEKEVNTSATDRKRSLTWFSNQKEENNVLQEMADSVEVQKSKKFRDMKSISIEELNTNADTG